MGWSGRLKKELPSRRADISQVDRRMQRDDKIDRIVVVVVVGGDVHVVENCDDREEEDEIPNTSGSAPGRKKERERGAEKEKENRHIRE